MIFPTLALVAACVTSFKGLGKLGFYFFPWVSPTVVIAAWALWWQSWLFVILLLLSVAGWTHLYRTDPEMWGGVRTGWHHDASKTLAAVYGLVHRKLGLAWFPHARAAAPVASAPAPAAGEVVVVRSTKWSGERLQVVEPLKLEEGQPYKGEITLVLDPSVQHQSFMGFGTALTEASARVFQQMGSASQERIVDAYFCKRTGLGFNIGRLHMNACDFSDGNWSCSEKDGDTELSSFSIARYEEGMLPLVRRAVKAAGAPLMLLASPWSPPKWMKENEAMCHPDAESPHKDKPGKLKESCRAAWAKHYVRFAEALRDAGFPLWGFTVQNEPDNAPPWEHCLYSPTEERDFIRDHLGPALEASGMDLKLVGWDHNRDDLFLRAHTIYSDPEAARFVWGMGWHWYGDPRFDWWADRAGQACFDNVRLVHELRPGKHLMVTETCQEFGPHIGDWALAERYAESIIRDFNNWAEAWIDWNMVLDQEGGPNHKGNKCAAPIIADTERDQVIFQPSYYAFGHFSRHLQPEARRILCAANRDCLEATAFANPDGTIVVVVLNQTRFTRGFCMVIEGRVARTVALPHSITTYVLRPPAAEGGK